MAEVFRKCCLLIVLLVLAGGMIEIRKAETSCSGGLGLCGQGNECEQRCYDSHGPGSQGLCDYTTTPPLCTCYYTCPPPPPPPPPSPPPPPPPEGCGGSGGSCPPPPPKECNGDGGLCSDACTDQCCSDRCAARFSIQGRGYCDNSAGPWLCQCQYPC